MPNSIYCDGTWAVVETGEKAGEYYAVCTGAIVEYPVYETIPLEFDPEAFALGFGGMLTLWVAGLTVGLILAQLRKLKRS